MDPPLAEWVHWQWSNDRLASDAGVPAQTPVGRLTGDGPALALPFVERASLFLAGVVRGDAVGAPMTADEAFGTSRVAAVRFDRQEASTPAMAAVCTSHPLAVSKKKKKIFLSCVNPKKKRYVPQGGLPPPISNI